MCGILGYFLKKPPEVEFDFKDLLESIQHRGPDAQAYFKEDTFLLGHTRLSILDLELGHQPYRYQNLILVFNGEIYNHRALRLLLLEHGYTFETRSDTEVLLKLYHLFGNDFITHLSGMFAFVIYNTDIKQVIMGRDSFGIKPLYIYQDSERLFFASEMLPLIKLLKHENIPIVLQEEALRQYLTHYYISQTPLIRGVREVAKGTLLQFEALNFMSEIHFQTKSNADAQLSLEDLLTDELKEQLDADVDVGILLSGGIDSSLLTALASKLKSPLHTFSIAFEDKKKFDESKYAEHVSKKFNTVHHTFLFNEETLLTYLPKLIETLDIPLYDPAMLPLMYLCDNVSKFSKVAISGDGGDELFSGYVHTRVLKYRRFYTSLAGLFHFLGFSSKAALIRSLLSSHPSFESAITHDLDVALPEQMLRKTDLCSMRFGLEVRVPYLSPRIFEFATKYGASRSTGLFFGKLPLRRLVSKHISFFLAYKKKQGFRVPIQKWVSEGKLGKIINQELTHSNLIPETLVSKPLISTYLSTPSKFFNELFSLYLLNEWLKKLNLN